MGAGVVRRSLAALLLPAAYGIKRGLFWQTVGREAGNVH